MKFCKKNLKICTENKMFDTHFQKNIFKPEFCWIGKRGEHFKNSIF